MNSKRWEMISKQGGDGEMETGMNTKCMPHNPLSYLEPLTSMKAL